MKPFLSIALAASLAVTGQASPHNHGRHHHPIRRDAATLVEKRVLTTVIENGPTVTVYELVGEGRISNADALAGLDDGRYSLVSTSDPEAGLPSKAEPSAGVFKEDDDEDGDAEAKVASSSPTTTTSSKTAAPTTEAASTDMTSTDGVDKEFPDGEYDCDTLPGGFGAVSADWLGMNGWLGLQWGTSSIVTGKAGDTCTDGAYCSYLCPEGYEKAQWPSTQGSNDESIGGLYCNNGKLEKTRSAAKTLCQKGQGGVRVTNSLSETVYMCRTDYPGTEAMLIPIGVAPGSTHEVTNPDQTSYLWKGTDKTSAQWYLNNAGLTRDQSCTWDSDDANISSAGDKSPTIFGTGMDAGVTYFSVFPNDHVSSATLNYNVRITVDGEETCSLVDNVYSGSHGCTGAGRSGQDILIEFY